MPNKEKHPFFLSMEEMKLRERFLQDVESQMSPYLWSLRKPEAVKVTILEIDGKTGKVVK